MAVPSPRMHHARLIGTQAVAGRWRIPSRARVKCGLVTPFHSGDVAGFAREAVSATQEATPRGSRYGLGAQVLAGLTTCLLHAGDNDRAPRARGFLSPRSMSRMDELIK